MTTFTLLNSRKVSPTRSLSTCLIKNLLFLRALKRRVSGDVFAARAREATKVSVPLWRLGVEKILRLKMRFLVILHLNQVFLVRRQQTHHQEKAEENMRNLRKSVLAGKRKKRSSFLMLQGLVQRPMKKSVVAKNSVHAVVLSVCCW